MNKIKKNLYKILILCFIAGITYCIEPLFNVPRALIESIVGTNVKKTKTSKNLKQEKEYYLLIDAINIENENLFNDWFRNLESIFSVKQMRKIYFKKYVPTSSKFCLFLYGTSNKENFDKFIVTNLSKFKLEYEGTINNLLLFKTKYVFFKKNLDVQEHDLMALLEKQQQINLQIFANDIVDFLEEITFLLPEQKKNVYDVSLNFLTKGFSLIPIILKNKVYFFGCYYTDEMPQKVFKIF